MTRKRESGRKTGLPDPSAVRARLRSTGERVTASREQVLAALMAAERALTHHELEAAIGPAPLDRVTLYRVLDWLVTQRLAHRMSGVDRVWRYSIADKAHESHAHFQCGQCGKVLCLEDVTTGRLPVRVPKGYQAEGVELTVTGHCAECA